MLMKSIALLFFFVCLAQLTPADMTIVQKLKSDLLPDARQDLSSQPQRAASQRPDSTMTMTIKGQQARIDLPASGMSSIIDAKEEKMFILLHRQKQVVVMSLEDLKKSAALAPPSAQDKTQPALPTAGRPVSDGKKTGRMATIQGYKCAEYEFSGAGDNPAEIRCWITEEVDDSELEFVRSFGGQMGGLFGFNNVQKPKGMVIRSKSKMNIAGRAITNESEVMSINRAPVSDSLFVIPADYEMVEMPPIGSALPVLKVSPPAAGKSGMTNPDTRSVIPVETGIQSELCPPQADPPRRKIH